MVDLLVLIPLLPLLGAIAMLLFGRRLKNAIVNVICVGSVLASFLCAVLVRPHEAILGQWLPLASADWGFLLDSLSWVMILVVTGIGSLIHIYSTGYMSHEGGYYRFFGYMNLFVAFMLLLVLANNYALMFVGWEGVGLCSYLLIGFYFRRNAASDAGMKAFIVNRVGDAGFILAMALMLATFGTVKFGLPAQPGPAVTAIAALLFVGAVGKSAQVPLHVWLPDAMEGPTPVSALIHAATMVTAGVYMIARSNALYSLSPGVLAVVTAIGAFTAIFAASIALVQTDIKRVLAYSTVSQLGFMFMALGVGAYWVAVFHLVTHAFFKALLFLGAGSVIHGMYGEQDMRFMGGLRTKMPITFWTMIIGAAAISGIPGLAGWFSKEEILSQVYSRGSNAVYIVGMVTAVMTAFYMTRMMKMIFSGEPKRKIEAHESRPVMTIPLVILAAGTLLIGWARPVFESFLSSPERRPGAGHDELQLTLAALIATFGGILLARYEIAGNIASILRKGWYVDWFYDALFVRGLAKGGGALLARVDSQGIDGVVNGAGLWTRLTSNAMILWDTYVIDGAVRFTSFCFKAASYPARVLQTGQMQTYAAFVLAGLLALIGVFASR